MTFGSLLRPPPRRRFARRIAAAFCIALFTVLLTTARAEAYPCGNPSGGRTLSSYVSPGDCPGPAKPQPEKRAAGEPNLVSLALFVAVVAGVLMIPINYSRRGDGEPE
jgi:hypothetical protein